MRRYGRCGVYAAALLAAGVRFFGAQGRRRRLDRQDAARTPGRGTDGHPDLSGTWWPNERVPRAELRCASRSRLTRQLIPTSRQSRPSFQPWAE
jgi:hypothetical protein